MSKSGEYVCLSHQFLVLGDFLQFRKSLGYFSADKHCELVSVVVVFGLRPVQDAGDEEFLNTLSEDIFQFDKILGGTLAVVDSVFHFLGKRTGLRVIVDCKYFHGYAY